MLTIKLFANVWLTLSVSRWHFFMGCTGRLCICCRSACCCAWLNFTDLQNCASLQVCQTWSQARQQVLFSQLAHTRVRVCVNFVFSAWRWFGGQGARGRRSPLKKWPGGLLPQGPVASPRPPEKMSGRKTKLTQTRTRLIQLIHVWLQSLPVHCLLLWYKYLWRVQGARKRETGKCHSQRPRASYVRRT